jgi:hypothetical protein
MTSGKERPHHGAYAAAGHEVDPDVVFLKDREDTYVRQSLHTAAP